VTVVLCYVLRYRARVCGAQQEALAAVKRSGLALQDTSAAMRADREVVLAAVKQNSTALLYAAPALMGDWAVIEAAQASARASSDLR
jgi:hypothetical protein